MKKQTLLILLLFLGIKLQAQNCNFTYYATPGSTLVDFVPNSAFSPSLYHFSWDFGDGTSSTVSTPSHIYNTPLPVVACCTILDSINNVVCTSCDTISTHSIPNCMFSFVNTSGMTFDFISTGSTLGMVVWDFGDNTNGAGNMDTHTYAAAGTYVVTMTVLDSANSMMLCSNSIMVTVNPISSTCTFIATAIPNTMFQIDFSATAPFLSSVTWDFGDNSVGTGSQISHTYTNAGTYTVCIDVVDPNGGTCHYCQPVTVGNITNNCNFTYTVDSLNPSSVTFVGYPAYPGSNVVWDFNDGSTGSGNLVTHVYSQSAHYMVCMTELDSNMNVVCTTCIPVIIGNSTNCIFYATQSSNPLALDFQINSGPASTVTWDFGDNSGSGQGASLNHLYNAPGVYQVCVTVGNGGAIVCTACSTVVVGGSIPCSITYYPDPFNPGVFTFSSAQSSSSSVLAWDFGDGTTAIGQSVSHAYNAVGPFTVCVIERDFFQNILCQSCTTITVNGGSSSGCQAAFLSTSNGMDAYFIDMSVPFTPTTTYAWDFGDNTTSNLRFPLHTYTSPGSYNVCLTITDGSCSDIYCSVVVADTSSHNPSLGCNAFFAFVQLAAYQVSIVNLSSGTNLSFDWDFGDGSAHDTSPYPSHYYTTTGSYNLCLTVADANGCSSTFCDTLSVDSLGNIFRSSTPGFTINILSPAHLTGVGEVKAQASFRAYPNPASSDLHISMISGMDKAKSFRILSMQGSEILNGNLNGKEGKLNVQSLSSGTYLLEITLTDGTRSYQSIVRN